MQWHLAPPLLRHHCKTLQGRLLRLQDHCPCHPHWCSHIQLRQLHQQLSSTLHQGLLGRQDGLQLHGLDNQKLLRWRWLGLQQHLLR